MKTRKLLLHCALLIPFIALWIFLLQFLAVLEWEGILSVIPDAFGKGTAIGMAALGVLAATSVIFLPLIIMKEWVIQVIAYSLTLLFCVVIHVSIICGEHRFETFSPEAWQDYPARRITMYTSFEEQYEPYGKEIDEVIALLGSPDKVEDDGSIFYSLARNIDIYGIYFYVVDGKVVGSYVDG